MKLDNPLWHLYSKQGETEHSCQYIFSIKTINMNKTMFNKVWNVTNTEMQQ